MNKKRILLIGDFSTVHSELKKSLEILGHKVVLISGGDGFKNLSRDLDIHKSAPNSTFEKIIGLLGELVGLRGIFYYFKIKHRILDLNLSSFDYIQVINPLAIQRCGAIANILFWFELKKSGTKTFLCALGTDKAYVKSSLAGKLEFNYFSSLSLKNFPRYIPSLRFLYFPFYGMLHSYAIKVSKKVIPGVYDYYLSYEKEPKRTEIIPLPISQDLIKDPIATVPEKLIIFYGKQKGRDLIKGYRDFDLLIENLSKQFPNKFEIIVTESLPYAEYLNMFKNCHIFLDQTNSHDRGVNALIGMAAGKIVLSGGGPESLAPYNTKGLKSVPLLNASPNVEDMISQIEKLIKNPNEVLIMSQSAIDFIKKNHNSIQIAKSYLDVWDKA